MKLQKEGKTIDPMEFYCNALKKYDHALYISGTNLPYGQSKYTHLSYQMINTLDFSETQFEHILNSHCSFIKNPINYLKVVMVCWILKTWSVTMRQTTRMN